MYPHRGFDLCYVVWHNDTPGTYVYYMAYCSKDASTVKFLVAATCILDTLHVSFMCHMLYHYLVKTKVSALCSCRVQSLQVTNYGVPTSLDYIVWSFPASALVNLLVIVVVQFFFAHKIYCLCRREVRWLVTVPIVSTFTCDDESYRAVTRLQ
ncbi:hypothetical protein F5141DRAFT_558353 [Pisolithus sp. B1]|nr:hypothetical protein F5141DRAFT_558353 [Pisolithus sp. B1]